VLADGDAPRVECGYSAAYRGRREFCAVQVVRWGWPVSGVFINYRGEDSDTAAALIDRELAARLDSDRVFLDSRYVPADTGCRRGVAGPAARTSLSGSQPRRAIARSLGACRCRRRGRRFRSQLLRLATKEP
jgi:hypothetical protein